MSRTIRRRPSPSMIVAGAALVVALAGTAIAGPLATKSVFSKSEKKQVKQLAKDQVNQLAPGLAVASANTANAANSANTANTAGSASTANTADNANNANTVDGANASDLKTSSGFDEDSSRIDPLGATPVTVAAATITTQSTGRILATGSAELFGADFGEQGACLILIDGTDSTIYHSAPDDIGTDNSFVIAVNFAVTRPAGTYTASLQCYAEDGTVGKDDAAINVYGLGA
jgi:hypothetical protein